MCAKHYVEGGSQWCVFCGRPDPAPADLLVNSLVPDCSGEARNGDRGGATANTTQNTTTNAVGRNSNSDLDSDADDAFAQEFEEPSEALKRVMEERREQFGHECILGGSCLCPEVKIVHPCCRVSERTPCLMKIHQRCAQVKGWITTNNSGISHIYCGTTCMEGRAPGQI